MEQNVPLMDRTAYDDRLEDTILEQPIDSSKLRFNTVSRWNLSDSTNLWLVSSQPHKSTGSKSNIPGIFTFRQVLPYLVAALPRFLQPGGLELKKLHPTSYLDALRGWAALAVFRFHSFTNRTWILDQEVFRGVMNGRAMVDLFFVISGYVLSYRMLKMMRNRQDILKILASSTFRRWFRLYASTGVATLIAILFVRFNWYKPELKADSFMDQLWDWFLDFRHASNPFADVPGWWYPGVFCTRYLFQMWSIPVEFRGSLVVFWFCAATSFLTSRGRRIFCLTVIAMCYVWGALYAAHFLWGVLIADYSLDRHPSRLLPTNIKSLEEIHQSIPVKLGYICLVILAFFLLGQPQPPGPDHSWLWKDYMFKSIPFGYPIEGVGQDFWLGIGSVLMIFALDNCRMLQIPLEWRFSQYLGDLSFGMYALHVPIHDSLYDLVIEPWRSTHLGDSYLSGLPGILITTFVVLWAADYFTRIDKKVIMIGKWLETKTFIK